MEQTPQQTAARLDLDERAVLLRPPGTFISRALGRAQWNLKLAGLLEPGHSRGRGTRVVFTPEGRAVRAILEGDFVDEEQGWGIRLTGRGEDCWWCADRNGYTLDLSQAGLYSRDEAASIHGRRYAGGGGPADVAVPPARMRALVDEALSRKREELSRAEQVRETLGAAP